MALPFVRICFYTYCRDVQLFPVIPCLSDERLFHEPSSERNSDSKHGKTQMVVVEWLTVMISHKQRTLENLKDGILRNVCVGEMDEYTRFCVTCGVNVEVVSSACDTSADIFTVILKSIGKKPISHCGERISRIRLIMYSRCSIVGIRSRTALLPTWHIMEIESKNGHLYQQSFLRTHRL